MRMHVRNVVALAGLLVAPMIPLAAQEPMSLQRAIELAQEQGHTARGARASLEAARYTDNAFWAQYMPQLSLTGTVPQYNHAIVPVLQPDGSTLFRSQNQTQSALSATLSQRLPTGGNVFVTSSLQRLQLSGDQSLRSWSSTPVSLGIRQDIFRPNTFALDRKEQPVRSELAEREYLEAREDVALRVTNLFFDLYTAQMGLQNAQANVAINDTLYTLNKGRYDIGKIAENDLLQSELALLRSRTSLDGARLDYERAEAALRLALNLAPGTPITLAVPGEAPAYVADSSVAAAQALRNVSDVSNTALQELVAKRRVAEAKLNNGFGATVQAAIGYNATAPEFSAAYQNLLEARSVSVSVEIPLIQWGSRHNRVAAAEAQLQQAEDSREATLDQIAMEARFAALQVEQTRRSLALSAKADTVAAKRFEVAYNRYSISRISIDNLYIAQSEKDQAIVQYLQALRQHWLAHYQLRRLTLFDFEKGEGLAAGEM
jgi:outer membrane protein TolC